MTALKPLRRGRVRVYLDGRPGPAILKSLAAELELGQRLDAAGVAELESRDRAEAAYRRAVRLLARRPRSERELRTRLSQSGLTGAEQERVVRKVQGVGLLSDAEFAAAWLENRMAFRPRGAQALRSELRGRGVPAEVIEAALRGFDEERAAARAARQGLRKYQHLSPELLRHRLSGYLLRRGFQHSTVDPLVEQLAVERESQRKDST